jgi:hypothetical protein
MFFFPILGILYGPYLSFTVFEPGTEVAREVRETRLGAAPAGSATFPEPPVEMNVGNPKQARTVGIVNVTYY